MADSTLPAASNLPPGEQIRLRVELINCSPHPVPSYASELAAGADLHAWLEAPRKLEPGRYDRIPTGLSVALPPGYEAQVRPRSGLAFRHGLTVLNSPGTIDADYRGEIQVLLINLGSGTVELTDGMRIAQLVVAPVTQAQFELVDKLAETTRGAGGFGHTGQ